MVYKFGIFPLLCNLRLRKGVVISAQLQILDGKNVLLLLLLPLLLLLLVVVVVVVMLWLQMAEGGRSGLVTLSSCRCVWLSTCRFLHNRQQRRRRMQCVELEE